MNSALIEDQVRPGDEVRFFVGRGHHHPAAKDGVLAGHLVGACPTEPCYWVVDLGQGIAAQDRFITVAKGALA